MCVRSQESDKRVISNPSQGPRFPFPSFRYCCAIGDMSSNAVFNMPSGQKTAHMICRMNSNMVCKMGWNMDIGRYGNRSEIKNFNCEKKFFYFE